MIGRASIGNPWIFKEIKHYLNHGVNPEEILLGARIDTVIKHLQNSIAWKGKKRGIFEMRKHYSNYFKGMQGIKKFKKRMLTTTDYNEILDILNEILVEYSS